KFSRTSRRRNRPVLPLNQDAAPSAAPSPNRDTPCTYDRRFSCRQQQAPACPAAGSSSLQHRPEPPICLSSLLSAHFGRWPWLPTSAALPRAFSLASSERAGQLLPEAIDLIRVPNLQ